MPLVASLTAVATGAVILAGTGSPAGTWIRTPLAWLLGFALAAGVLRAPRSARARPAVLLAAALGLALTFLDSGQDGVHRWIELGPLRMNVAMLVLPVGVVALAAVGVTSREGIAFAATVAALLLVQPDASQATAFLGAVAILLVRSPVPTWARLAGLVPVTAAAVLVWARPDPLERVAEVEGIFSLASDLSPAVALVAALALAVASLVPAGLRSSRPTMRSAASALTAYLVLAAVAPAFGAFPVPLVGLGMSAPIGYLLGCAWLVRSSDQGSLHARA